MIKKTTILLIVNLLLILGNLYSQDEYGLLEGLFPEEEHGFYVAVYALREKSPDFNKLIAKIGKGAFDKNKTKLIYFKRRALVTPFNSKPYGYFPATLSINEEFKNFKWPLRENLFIHWKGKIIVPKGYFALKITKADDEASVFIYEDSKDGDSPYKYKPFVTKSGISLPPKNLNWDYYKKEQTVNIEIFYLQRKKHFSLSIEAIIGLELEEIAVEKGKKKEELVVLEIEEDIIFNKKNGHWKPL